MTESESLLRFGDVSIDTQLNAALLVTSSSALVVLVVVAVVARCVYVFHIHLVPVKGLTHRRRSVEHFFISLR